MATIKLVAAGGEETVVARRIAEVSQLVVQMTEDGACSGGGAGGLGRRGRGEGGGGGGRRRPGLRQ